MGTPLKKKGAAGHALIFTYFERVFAPEPDEESDPFEPEPDEPEVPDEPEPLPLALGEPRPFRPDDLPCEPPVFDLLWPLPLRPDESLSLPPDDLLCEPPVFEPLWALPPPEWLMEPALAASSEVNS